MEKEIQNQEDPDKLSILIERIEKFDPHSEKIENYNDELNL